MGSEAPSLAALQARFFDAVVRGDDSILDLIPHNSRTSNAVLLGVYQHAYVARLIEVLRNDYPLLAVYIGDDAFDRLARAYIAEHPSRHPNARWFGAKLPELAGAFSEFEGHADIGELAALEHALGTAFDAADLPPLDLARMAQYPPETWGDLSFTPHVSAATLDFTTNAFAIWQALKNEDLPPPEAVVLPERQTLLVWRHGTRPMVRVAGAEEAMMWREAGRGATFSRLCELVAVFGDSEGAALRAAGHLQQWLAAGLLAAPA